MKILTIVPSIYPEKLSKMLDSYYATVNTANLVINSEKKSVTAVFNDIFAKYPTYDYYFMANDDIIFHTKDWDVKLANKGKISHGNDSIAEGVNGQFMMIDGDIVRALGWLQLPTLERYSGDVVWRFLGQQLGILHYVPEVQIEHNWHGCPDLEVNKADMAAFATWLPVSHHDVEKIRRFL